MEIREAQDEDYAEVARLRSQTIRHVNSKDYPEEIIDGWSFKLVAASLTATADKI